MLGSTGTPVVITPILPDISVDTPAGGGLGYLIMADGDSYRLQPWGSFPCKKRRYCSSVSGIGLAR
jgi:hypothetical protein